jgi:nucleotide-binding universal stress UspA family protein
MQLLEKHWTSEEEGVHPEFRVDFGPPAERILESAAMLRIDLLVLGVRGTHYPRVAAHLPGPTAYDVVLHARCPVLVIRGGVQSGE